MTIIICPEPHADFSLIPYCAVINLADTQCRLSNSPVPYYWYPINEMEFWSYGPFFFTSKIVDMYQHETKPIMIHCHAGVNRSVSVAYAIYMADKQCGIQHECLNDSWKDRLDVYKRTFETNIRRGHIPEDIITFLMARHDNPGYSLLGLIQNACGIQRFHSLLPQYYQDLAKNRI